MKHAVIIQGHSQGTIGAETEVGNRCHLLQKHFFQQNRSFRTAQNIHGFHQHLFCPGRIFEDNEAVCRWVCAAKRLARIQTPLYFYRTNPISTTQNRFSKKKLDYLWALESITGYFGSIGYGVMQKRFADRYADAAAESCYGLRCQLDRPELAKEVYRNTRRYFRKQKLTMTRPQFEKLLDAAHPELIRYYWPLAGILRRLGLIKGERL